jgi:hypothetical protein
VVTSNSPRFTAAQSLIRRLARSNSLVCMLGAVLYAVTFALVGRAKVGHFLMWAPFFVGVVCCVIASVLITFLCLNATMRSWIESQHERSAALRIRRLLENLAFSFAPLLVFLALCLYAFNAI